MAGKENIVLIGMPASGKSTVGVILAKILGKEFIDTDIVIQRREGASLQEIIDKEGIDHFLECEEKALLSTDVTDAVISTGGSAVYSDTAMKYLSEGAVVVYLKIGLHDLKKRLKGIKERGVVMKPGESLEDMYAARSVLYEKYADITVSEEGEQIEETVSAVAEELRRSRQMKYFRVHTEDIAYLTQKPRGLFTAVYKLVESKLLSENEEKEYWKNRAYFEKVLPLPPFYEQGNPDGAITWYKDNEAGNRIFREMVFYRRMLDRYGKKLFITECEVLPGTLIYEDDFQIAVKDQKQDLELSTKELVWPIREIDENDISQCVDVIRKSFMTVADQFGFTKENAPRFTAFATDNGRLEWQMKAEHRPMFGYFEGAKIIGYYSLFMQEEGQCELNNLCVLPEYRHKCIGKELLLDAFSRASELGIVKMNIGIVEENRVLRRWYEEQGFVHTGTQKFDFFPFTCGYMSKDLSDE